MAFVALPAAAGRERDILKLVAHECGLYFYVELFE
jgi:hypothetical protein